MFEDAQWVKACRQMWRRWWWGLSCDERDEAVEGLCVLPRGAASDDGWLSV